MSLTAPKQAASAALGVGTNRTIGARLRAFKRETISNEQFNKPKRPMSAPIKAVAVAAKPVAVAARPAVAVAATAKPAVAVAAKPAVGR